jgi:hypothetical protein
MTYLDTTIDAPEISIDDPTPIIANYRAPVVLVMEDGRELSDALRALCAFLGIRIERLDSSEPLLPFLMQCRPMAVIAPMEAKDQDGANVLMAVGRHDPSLPVLVLTGSDPSLAGAVDAVTELWRLTAVVQSLTWPSLGEFAEFLCRAGMQGRCLALLPV